MYGTGETDAHYLTKTAIYDSILASAQVSRVELEYRLTGVRPDVYFERAGAKVAIEIQKTAQTIEEMQRRTVAYDHLGVHVLWILPENAPAWINDQANSCRVQVWHQFLHTAYFGRLYFWQHGRFVRAAHLTPSFRDIPEGNWVEDYEEEIGEDLSGTNWYQETHDEADYGGGRRFLKSQKTVSWKPIDLDIVRDFRPTNRTKFDCKRYSVPACRLWMDTGKNWWPSGAVA
jgi:hypothetical protein